MLRAALRRLASGGVILCYHGLTDSLWPAASPIHLPRELFESQVDLLRRCARLVSLRDLLEAHYAGRDTRGLVALTFDDAYASLMPSASFFRSEKVPITVFVVTGAAESAAPFWWDRIEDLFPRVSPERWRRFEDDTGLPDDYRRGQPPAYGPLRPLRQWVLAVYRGRWPGVLEPALAGFEDEMGFRTVQRAMSWEELRELSAMAPVEIGVHTQTHPVLPLVDEEDFEREVRGAWDAVETRLARALPVLAIPYGLYDERTVPLANRAGMRAALSLEPRSLRRTEPGALPRHCLTIREAHWKLAVRLTGLADLIGAARGGGNRYPALPSATT